MSGFKYFPFLFRAEQLALAQHPDKENQPNKPSRGGSFFKKKAARRAKSLGKDHWDDVIDQIVLSIGRSIYSMQSHQFQDPQDDCCISNQKDFNFLFKENNE